MYIYIYVCFILLAVYPRYTYMKAICIFETHVCEVFLKRVLSRDFAFKHKLGTLMPKNKF